MTVKLEVGKFYKDSKGEKRGPIRNSSSSYDYLGSHAYFRGNGLSIGGHDDDLVSEWVDSVPSPITTVTTKQVAPGVYGRVQVLAHSQHNKAVVLEFIGGDIFSATELTQTIETLALLRGYLQEKDK